MSENDKTHLHNESSDEERFEWQHLRERIERGGFMNGAHDVLHFADEEVQSAAWYRLAEMEGDADQAVINNYLRSLAPKEMMYIPAGSFLMGSTEDDPNAANSEKPQHEMWLNGYYIERYPVTNEEYRAFIEAGGYQARAHWTGDGWVCKEQEGWTVPGYWTDLNLNQPRQPVVGVSWYEAVAYCRWRGVRLPTEAEWEKVAGWDPVERHKRRYPWGDEWDKGKRVYNPENWPNVGNISSGETNAYGVHDMVGLYVWCSTRWGTNRFHPDYGYPCDVDDDREDLSGGDGVLRIVRGGGSTPGFSRCACRTEGYPWGWDHYVGLRCVAPRHPRDLDKSDDFSLPKSSVEYLDGIGYIRAGGLIAAPRPRGTDKDW